MQVGEETTAQAPASHPFLPPNHWDVGDPGMKCPLPWAPKRGHKPQGSHSLKTKSPSAEEVPDLGALFLESPKASFPGQISHPPTPPLQPGSRGEDAKPTQKPEISHRRKASPTSPCCACSPGPGGGCLAFSALSLVLVTELFFIPLCHMEIVPMTPLGVDRCSHKDQLFKKLPLI